MSKGLYRFYWDCGRMGEVDSLFVADEADVEKIIGKEIYFGEILGKHSEIYGVVEKKDFTLVTTDEKVVELLKDLSFGHNPFHYFEEDEGLNEDDE